MGKISVKKHYKCRKPLILKKISNKMVEVIGKVNQKLIKGEHELKKESYNPLNDTSFGDLKSVHLLVRWVGSDPVEYDVISSEDLIIDQDDTPGILEPESLVMVRCGCAKSPAHIVSISDDTDYLNGEMKKLYDRSRNIATPKKISNGSMMKKSLSKENNNKENITKDDNNKENQENKNEKISQKRPRPKSDESVPIKKKILKTTQKPPEPLEIFKVNNDENSNKDVLVLAYEKLKDEYNKLQLKYESLKRSYNDIRGNMRAILDNTEELDDKASNKVLPETKKDETTTYVSRKEYAGGEPTTAALKPFNKQDRNGTLASNNRFTNNNGKCPIIELSDKILIGSGRTPIPRSVYNQINWHSFTAATRKLLMAVFDRQTLATHTLTGKPSPAFVGIDSPKAPKMKLDHVKVSDIVEIVSTRCGVSDSMVRSSITTKCADENKMLKKRLKDTASNENEASITGLP